MELKPCPFCGRIDPVRDDRDRVGCISCSYWLASPAAWNRRAPAADEAALDRAANAVLDALVVRSFEEDGTVSVSGPSLTTIKSALRRAWKEEA